MKTPPPMREVLKGWWLLKETEIPWCEKCQTYHKGLCDG